MDNILEANFCNYTKDCNSNCGYSKIRLSCSIICGDYHGQSCLNTMFKASTIDSSIINYTKYDEISPINLLIGNISDNDKYGEVEELKEHENEIKYMTNTKKRLNFFYTKYGLGLLENQCKKRTCILP